MPALNAQRYVCTYFWNVSVVRMFGVVVLVASSLLGYREVGWGVATSYYVAEYSETKHYGWEEGSWVEWKGGVVVGSVQK
jgi:hypothetical protein